MLFNLGVFHSREVKPAQWAVFDSAAKDEDDLLDDLDALAGLVAIGPVEPIKRSFARTYSYSQQETKLRIGKKATVPVFDGAPISDVNPVDYLAATLRGIFDGYPQSGIEDLMPWRFHQPSSLAA